MEATIEITGNKRQGYVLKVRIREEWLKNFSQNGQFEIDHEILSPNWKYNKGKGERGFDSYGNNNVAYLEKEAARIRAEIETAEAERNVPDFSSLIKIPLRD